MSKRAGTFACAECGEQAARWSGRCQSCGAMNSLVEVGSGEARLLATAGSQKAAAARLRPTPLADGDDEDIPRLATGIAELDRVLGGGLPKAAAVLIGGEPGIGKSTLLAQACGGLVAAGRVCYVTAEESVAQVRARCRRLGVDAAGVELAGGNDVDAIAGTLRAGEHAAVVVDSVQVLTAAELAGAPGSPSQVRAATATLVEAAKAGGTALLLVGHVTKDGQLAGPRMLEHLVDTVLNFEGDRYQDLRTLRAVKNRFGTTNEIGLFAMGERGLQPIENPSACFIEGRDAEVPGSCVVPALEGNRCLLVEIQALVATSDLPQPQRRVTGCDPNRVAMIAAVLARRERVPLAGCDLFVNVTGGARIFEPAADLGIGLALVSAWRDRPVPADLAALGEIGLGGELRAATRYDLRAAEARRLGFQRLVGPGAGKGRGRVVVKRLGEAVEVVFG